MSEFEQQVPQENIDNSIYEGFVGVQFSSTPRAYFFGYKDIELEWGYNVNNDPLFREFKTKELSRLVTALNQQKKAKILKSDGIEKLQSKIERLENL